MAIFMHEWIIHNDHRCCFKRYLDLVEEWELLICYPHVSLECHLIKNAMTRNAAALFFITAASQKHICQWKKIIWMYLFINDKKMMISFLSFEGMKRNALTRHVSQVILIIFDVMMI